MTPIVTKYGLFIVFAFVAIEAFVSWRRKDGVYAAADTVSNVATGLVGNLLARFVWTAIGYATYTWANALTPLRIAMDTWWSWALLIVLSDLAWYWEHRAGHRMRLFWAVHSIHHSSEKYNYSVALRLPWLGGLVRIPFLLPLAFLGFEPVAVYTGFSLVFLYQIWIHTEYVGKLGPLEAVLNTPSHHRVHHARNERYLDKNFGGITILWDRLFGTFAQEEEAPDFGILHPLGTHNPLVVNSRDLVATFKTLRHARSPKDAAQILFGDPAQKFGSRG